MDGAGALTVCAAALATPLATGLGAAPFLFIGASLAPGLVWPMRLRAQVRG